MLRRAPLSSQHSRGPESVNRIHFRRWLKTLQNFSVRGPPIHFLRISYRTKVHKIVVKNLEKLRSRLMND